MFYFYENPSMNAEIMAAYADQRNQLALQGKHGARDRPAKRLIQHSSTIVYNQRSN
jgi:hypothetical protein